MRAHVASPSVVYGVDAPPGVLGAPRVAHHGGWAYWHGSRWYHHDGARWGYFHEEPPYLYRHRPRDPCRPVARAGAGVACSSRSRCGDASRVYAPAPLSHSARESFTRASGALR